MDGDVILSLVVLDIALLLALFARYLLSCTASFSFLVSCAVGFTMFSIAALDFWSSSTSGYRFIAEQMAAIISSEFLLCNGLLSTSTFIFVPFIQSDNIFSSSSIEAKHGSSLC